MLLIDLKYSQFLGFQCIFFNVFFGFVDIWFCVDLSFFDGIFGIIFYEYVNIQLCISNYMVLWVFYVFDWCKWVFQGNSVGKVVIGSYLEDGYNYVSICE